MSRKMDKELEQLEERLTALYVNATNEVKAKFTDFMSDYKKQYEEMTRQYENGDITKEDYTKWCNKKIIQSDKYKQTVNSLTKTLVNTDVEAMAVINGELPLVVAQSYNFVQSLGFRSADEEGMSVGTFQIYNAKTIEAIIKDNPDLLPNVDLPEDTKWNKDKINTAISQGIVQGDSIPQVANRLQTVTNMDRNSAIRNARTSMTAAENLGRTESAKELKEKGIPIKEQWHATHDSRTRDSHLLLDGTYKDENGYYGVGIIDTPLRFPGDPLGAPEEIYNCRCREGVVLAGIDHSQDDKLYEEFMKENYPKDWKNIQESEREQARRTEAEKTVEKQTVLRDKNEISNSIKNVDNFSGRKDVVNALYDMNEQERNAWVQAIRHTEYDISEKKADENFSYTTGHATLSKTSDSMTFFHETAHAIDGNAVTVYRETRDKNGDATSHSTREGTASGTVGLLYKQDEGSKERDDNALMEFAGINNLNYSLDNMKAMRSAIRELDYDEDTETTFSDIIDAYTNGELRLAYSTGGHERDYWDNPLSSYMEIWSNFCSLKATGEDKAINELRTILPETTKYMEDVYNAVFLGDNYVDKHTINGNGKIKEEIIIIRRSNNL